MPIERTLFKVSLFLLRFRNASSLSRGTVACVAFAPSTPPYNADAVNESVADARQDNTVRLRLGCNPIPR